jgi:hypothetical protein
MTGWRRSSCSTRRATRHARLGPADWGLVAARRRLGALRQRAGSGQGPPSEGRGTPPLAVYRDQLDRLLARGVKIFAIFTGALNERYNESDQLFEYAPELRGRVDVAYFPNANHTFTERAQQATLLDAVTGWIDRVCGDPD